MKNPIKSKTVRFGLAVATIPWLVEITPILENADAPPWLLSLIGLVIVGLRYVTGEPLRGSNVKTASTNSNTTAQ